jgi:hypothetical protein
MSRSNNSNNKDFSRYLSNLDDELEDLLKSHRERINARIQLSNEDRIELMTSVKEWMRKNHLSRKICSDVHDELNNVIQNLPSKQIKLRNGLAKSALIRDYYDTSTLIDYSCLSRITANLVRCGIEPIEAVHISATLGLHPERIPQEIPLIENIHKVTKILEAKKRELELTND